MISTLGEDDPGFKWLWRLEGGHPVLRAEGYSWYAGAWRTWGTCRAVPELGKEVKPRRGFPVLGFLGGGVFTAAEQPSSQSTQLLWSEDPLSWVDGVD